MNDKNLYNNAIVFLFFSLTQEEKRKESTKGGSFKEYSSWLSRDSNWGGFQEIKISVSVSFTLQKII